MPTMQNMPTNLSSSPHLIELLVGEKLLKNIDNYWYQGPQYWYDTGNSPGYHMVTGNLEMLSVPGLNFEASMSDMLLAIRCLQVAE